MKPDRPHLVLMMADHLRRDSLSCYGDLPVNTPHLDAMARESVVFDNAYCSTPLCVPTRISMYTGRWPHSNDVIVNGGRYPSEQEHARLRPHQRTLYEQLDDAGYRINHVGVHHCRATPTIEQRVPKAHFDPAQEMWAQEMRARGYDPDIVLKMSHAFRRPGPEFVNGRLVQREFPTPHAIGLYPYPPEMFPDMFWAARAERMIEQLDPSQPQFIETLFWAPHPALVLPEPYYSMYPAEKIDLPESVAEWYPGQPASLLVQFGGFYGAGLARDHWRAAWSAHLGMTTIVDECLGRVIAALKRRGIWDNALVVFVQDHGEMLGCHSLWEKHCCYEESAHIPLLIKPPANPAPEARRGQFTGHIDLADTFCDYAGAARLPDSQGQSLRPVLERPEAAWREETFVEYNGNHGRGIPMRSIVARRQDRRFKYIYTWNDIDELYDLDADPLEKCSLVQDPKYQTLRRSLRSDLAQWCRSTGDFMTIGEEDPLAPLVASWAAEQTVGVQA